MEPEFPGLIQRLRNIEGISPQQWREAKDRKQILENVHKEIANAYGFEPCTIYFKNLQPRMRAAFGIKTHTIILHERFLEETNPEEPMRIMARESRIAYLFHVLHQPIDPSLPHEQQSQIEDWKQSIESFSSQDYRNHPFERDASAFANQLIHDLYKM